MYYIVFVLSSVLFMEKDIGNVSCIGRLKGDLEG